MKKIFMILTLLLAGIAVKGQQYLGKKVTAIDSVVTNHINARAGDVVTVLKALAVDQGLTVTGNSTFSGNGTFSSRIQTAYDAISGPVGGLSVNVASGEVAALSLDEDVRWWTWTGGGENSLNFARGTNYDSNTPTITLLGDDATFSGNVTTNTLDVLNGTSILNFGATFGGDGTLTNNTNKTGRIGVPHYNNSAEESVALAFIQTDATKNQVNIGGGSAVVNAATEINFYTAANTTTTTGTNQMSISSDGSIDFNDYGSGSNTGTATYLLAVDASGNVIEESLGAGGVSQSTGTFTPVIRDAQSGGNTASGGTIAGSYIRTGDKVTVSLNLQNFATTGMTGGNPLYITDLPFDKDASFDLDVGSMDYDNDLTVGGDGAVPLINDISGNTYIVINEQGLTSNVTVSDVNSGNTSMRITITYITDAP